MEFLLAKTFCCCTEMQSLKVARYIREQMPPPAGLGEETSQGLGRKQMGIS